MKTLVVFVIGAVAATATILACSDDSPSDADAAACDCPAAEPPLAGRITRVRGLDTPLAANDLGAAFARCPAGSTLLSGSCSIVDDGGGNAQAMLRSADFDPTLATQWNCGWENRNGFPATVHAEAVCLVPAP